MQTATGRTQREIDSNLIAVRVYRSIVGNPKHYLIGRCVRSEQGWKFLSNVASHKNSRRFWPSWEACLPRWTGGLNGTSSEAIYGGGQ